MSHALRDTVHSRAVGNNSKLKNQGFHLQIWAMKKYFCVMITFLIIVAAGQAQDKKATKGTESLQDLFQTALTPPEDITIFTAKEVVTMSERLNDVTAIAVRDGYIIEAGEKDALIEKFKSAENLKVDESFKDKVIVPGFIDNHLHFWLFALVSNFHFITPADWQLPWGDVKGVVGQDNYIARLKELDGSIKDPKEVIFTWGYHEAFHGELNRKILDDVSKTRPIFVWQRSVHEFFFNTKALELMGLEEKDWQGKGESTEMSSWEEGHVWEKGLYMVIDKIFPMIASPEKFEQGLERTREYVHAGGITTASDPGVMLPGDLIRQMVNVLESGPMPFDYYLIPAGNAIYDANEKDADLTVEIAKQMVKENNGEKVKWVDDQIKLFTDGAVFSQLMQMKDGYLDGHEGEWIQTPEDFAKSAWAFWKNNYQIIVHQNGDLGMEVGLNTLEGMMHRYPRFGHRFRFDHFAFSEKSQLARVAELGAEISSNPFYLHLLGEKYSDVGVGPERAEVMARGRSVLDEDIRLSFHSDAPMAPARPMFLVWAAVNRIGLSGEKVLGPEEKVNVEEAFRAVTIDAAFAMHKENEIGSIDIGKKANFTIFEENPLTADSEILKDLKIWGTVYEGEAFPIKKKSIGMGVLPKLMGYSKLAMHTMSGDEHDHMDACLINQMLQTYAASLNSDEFRKK